MTDRMHLHPDGVEAFIEALAGTARDLPQAASGDWRDSALCRAAPPNWWHPERGQTSEPARLICQACPVRAACLDDALTRSDTWGIRAGLSGKQRQALRVERQASAVQAFVNQAAAA